MRTLKTGQVARWGEHLIGDLPYTYQAGTKGVYQIQDIAATSHGNPLSTAPSGKTFITVNRSKDKLGADPDQWWKHKNAYVSDLNVAKKFRSKPGAPNLTGGRALSNFNKTVFEHFDKSASVKQPRRRGITSRTTAGAYEDLEPSKRTEATGNLVRGYQKLGFKIDRSESSNPYNISMIRKPGATKQRPMTDDEIMTRAKKYQGKAIRKEVRGIGRGLAEVAPGAVVAAGGTALGTSATVADVQGKKDEHTKSKEIIGGVLGVGGGAALYRKRGDLARIGKGVGELALEGRVILGHKLSNRFPGLSKQVLRGFVGT